MAEPNERSIEMNHGKQETLAWNHMKKPWDGTIGRNHGMEP
jgi:hypothetical protein